MTDRMPTRDRTVSVVALSPLSSVRIHRPAGLAGPLPALLWIHGGGFVFGAARQDDQRCAQLADDLGIIVAAVDYRLAPEHPFPAALEDCHDALVWLAAHPDVDADRIAVGGASAGGGLAASLALLARERAVVSPAFQLLVYPMLDDRTASRPDPQPGVRRLWNHASNRFAWRAYLGGEPGSAAVSATAAPARCTDLADLPPAWIGVGTLDLFHDEDLDHARRLEAAGVPCALEVVDGAFHGFDVLRKARVSREFLRAQSDALRAALAPSGRPS
ncbi:MAG TPA: alpha/beta hydrolase [Nocardioides sp.]|nr:alpha/beta hydrolase [Nocardioides sp.]